MKKMNRLSRTISRHVLARAIAQLMPNIIRGVQLEFFVKKGVTQTQFLMMGAIHAYGRCPMGTLARSLHISMPTASGIVDRLVRAGRVQRVSHPDDRRQVMVELTRNGQEFIRQFQGVVSRRWEDVLQSLAPSECEALYRVVIKLQEQLTSSR